MIMSRDIAMINHLFLKFWNFLCFQTSNLMPVVITSDAGIVNTGRGCEMSRRRRF